FHAVRRKARSERKDSPDRRTARAWDGRSCENRMLQCGGLGCAKHHATSVQRTAVTWASRAGAAPRALPACGGDGSVGSAVVRQRCIKELLFGAIQWPKMWR